MRTFRNTQAGKPFAVKWIEWHVECAGGCDAGTLLLEMGKAETAREAEQCLRNGPDDGDDWIKIDGLWYCPACAAAKGGA